MDLYQQVIYKSRYARWLEEDKRRENWDETVDRYLNFFIAKFPTEEIPWDDLRNSIINLEVMPSMRALMTAGKALEKDNIAGFNCSYIAVDNPRAFDEAQFILMCGVGVGFSVERQYVNLLPEIAEEFHETDTTIVVKDSKIGWATALRELLSLLWMGQVPKWDLSKLRPAGARLKTFGGRSSGPGPLNDLFNFAVNLFRNASGRRLSSLECHDLMCKIAEVTVVGGVRRSALISLSNLSDDRMRHAKDGQWWIDNPQRSLANNTAVYTEKPDPGIFMQEWLALYSSKSGERGIMNRKALKHQVSKTERRNSDFEFGLNPCAEIILRSQQFCNLTEVVIREHDTLETLKKKVKCATILGTLQASLTDFRYLRKTWRDNTEEEALLGVSLTGIMDNKITADIDDEHWISEQTNLGNFLDELKREALKVNKKYSKMIGINQSVSLSAVKPSGTVSQLVNSASGIHARFSKYYIRRIRMDKKDPLANVLIDSKVPFEDDIVNPSAHVFSFPIKSPENSVTVDEMSAIQQLNHWLKFRTSWCEHNPSVTIYVREHEWMEVGAWVYKNFDNVGGLSFLPLVGYTYKQQPYEKITKEQYEAVDSKMPKSIDWDILSNYEIIDQTTGTQELACVSGTCEI